MIILYDFKTQISAQDRPSISPNTIKVIAVLNYKRIPFVIEYVNYHEVQDKVKSIGGTPSHFAVQNVDGNPRYTVPTIRDTTTSAVISDSTAIAEYLDKAYPETPSGALFPHGSRAAIALFEETYKLAFRPLYPIIVPNLNKMLSPASQGFHRNVTETTLQRKFEELPRLGSPEHEAVMTQTQKAYDRLAKLYERNGKDSLWFFGDKFSFADVVASSFLAAFMLMMGEDSEEWKEIASWNEGRWARLVDATKNLRTASSNEAPGANNQ